MKNKLQFQMLFVTVVCLLSLCISETSTSLSSFTHYCKDNTTCSIELENSYCDFEEKLQCGEGVCNCLPTHVAVALDSAKPENITCLPKPPSIGANCDHEIQCTSAFGELSSCIHFPFNGTCQCKPNSVYCPDKNVCCPKRNFAERCQCTEQCLHLPDAECIETFLGSDGSRCACKGNHMEAPDGSACIMKAISLYESCDVHPYQCRQLPNSICDPISKACICDSTDWVPNSFNRSCIPKIDHLMNTECEVDAQCRPANSACIYKNIGLIGGKFCSCLDGYVKSLDMPNICLTVAKVVGNKCTEHQQCTSGKIGKNSECNFDKGQCECKMGYAYHDRDYPEFGQCWPVVPLGGKCRMNEQCVDRSDSNRLTSCSGSVCKCIYSEVDGMCKEYVIEEETTMSQ